MSSRLSILRDLIPSNIGIRVKSHETAGATLTVGYEFAPIGPVKHVLPALVLPSLAAVVFALSACKTTADRFDLYQPDKAQGPATARLREETLWGRFNHQSTTSTYPVAAATPAPTPAEGGSIILPPALPGATPLPAAVPAMTPAAAPAPSAPPAIPGLTAPAPTTPATSPAPAASPAPATPPPPRTLPAERQARRPRSPG